MKTSQKMKWSERKNKKLVAWLLNRSDESLKTEREEFFKQMNEPIDEDDDINLEHIKLEFQKTRGFSQVNMDHKKSP